MDGSLLFLAAVLSVVLAVILAVILAVVFTVVPAVIALPGVEGYLVEDAAEDTAVRRFELLLDTLRKAVTDGAALDHKDGAIAILAHDGAVDDASERRRIDNDVVIDLPGFADELCKELAVQKLAGRRCNGPGEDHLEAWHIRVADGVFHAASADKIIG